MHAAIAKVARGRHAVVAAEFYEFREVVHLPEGYATFVGFESTAELVRRST